MSKIFDVIRFITEITGTDFLSKVENPDKIREIRLRACKEIILKEEKLIGTGIKISSKELENIFSFICEYSLHSYQHDINNGFITLDGGHRVGIAGTAVTDETGNIINVKNISSLNIRIAREFIGISDKFLKENCFTGGMLIVGGPGCGKTTLLRDITRNLASENTVVIVDERSEIAAVRNGIPQFNIGKNCDVLNGFSKPTGITFGIKSMGPDIIVCDEIGMEQDINPLIFAMNSGVKIIATAHGEEGLNIFDKPVFKELINANVFEKIVIMGNRPGQIIKVFNGDSLYAENNRELTHTYR